MVELWERGAFCSSLPYCNVEHWPPVLSFRNQVSVLLSGISFSKMERCVLLKNASVQRPFFLPPQILPRSPAMTGPGEMAVSRAGLVQSSEAYSLCGSRV